MGARVTGAEEPVASGQAGRKRGQGGRGAELGGSENGALHAVARGAVGTADVLLLGASVLVLGASACGGSSGPPRGGGVESNQPSGSSRDGGAPQEALLETPCAAMANQLEACGLPADTVDCAFLASGAASPSPKGAQPNNELERDCWARCMSQAPCGLLSALACEAKPLVSVTDPAALAFEACFEECLLAFGFACHDPPTRLTSIPTFVVCDGIPDCADGSDESNCSPLRCDDNRVVSAALVCDDFPDCDSGADEPPGCPTFECEDASLVPEAFRCDGETDCADGSDESGCAVLDCSAFTAASE